MKRIFVLLFIFIYCFKFNAQYNFEIGLNIGGTGYLGEIGGTSTEGKGFLGDLILKETNLTAGIFGKYISN